MPEYERRSRLASDAFEFATGGQAIMFGRLRTYIYNRFYPQPPPNPQLPSNAAFGYRWRALQGVPNELTTFDLDAGLAPGLYVAFAPINLDDTIEPFGGGGGPGPVYVVPGVPSAAVTTVINQGRANPPPGQAELFNNATPQRLAEITGFLDYAASCLNSINATATGAQLLQRLDGGPTSVFISPSMFSNQTFAGGPAYVNGLTAAIQAYDGGRPFNRAQLTALVNQRYATIDSLLARFNQLATDMNNLPLASLFTQYNPAGPGFLYSFFRFRGERMTGRNLMNWLSDGGFSAFDANVRTFARVFEGITVRQYFLLALNIILYPVAPPGAGASAGVKFHVINENDNVLGSAGFRPPAVGLAHELMHAMHYGRGTSPGFEINDFTTTAAELLFAGIGPFATQPITENAIRAQWNTIPVGNLHPSNVWAAPAQRLIYEPPVAPMTRQTLRAMMGCI
ncbi:hypothetical protein [Sorangium sp. So ce124]|uniref:hypothetical protein n=1 Tax=Sorangium sp. So ce124 TaxID=3133280 RepID=UPI003F6139EB